MSPGEYYEFGNEFFKWFLIIAGATLVGSLIVGWFSSEY